MTCLLRRDKPASWLLFSSFITINKLQYKQSLDTYCFPMAGLSKLYSVWIVVSSHGAQWLNCSIAVETRLTSWVQSQKPGSRFTQPSILPVLVNWVTSLLGVEGAMYSFIMELYIVHYISPESVLSTIGRYIRSTVCFVNVGGDFYWGTWSCL